ncbi:YbaN family protein [Belnapia sp. T18]|uniref:YbaN family protein n=1 Tax=Belnapia arida TaxID=2804533 RepID=A0ABS1UCX2_9PROT|nr:YbaN family protein [Belnapia arida]MBL6082499.1 YbaN family protein [Belnapia arida]
MRGPQRWLWLWCGYLSLALAAVGAVLPLMPTTVFLLSAAWCFGRASPALRARLLANPRYGPTLRDWQDHGCISRRAKKAAVFGMALSWLVVAVAFRNLVASAIAAACLVMVGSFIVTRPSRPG